jgi:hypothetical protein
VDTPFSPKQVSAQSKFQPKASASHTVTNTTVTKNNFAMRLVAPSIAVLIGRTPIHQASKAVLTTSTAKDKRARKDIFDQTTVLTASDALSLPAVGVGTLTGIHNKVSSFDQNNTR